MNIPARLSRSPRLMARDNAALLVVDVQEKLIQNGSGVQVIDGARHTDALPGRLLRRRGSALQ